MTTLYEVMCADILANLFSPKAVLNQWFWDHADRPFPDNNTKKELSSKTGLKIRQIDNWFSNTRRRNWRRQRQKWRSSIMPLSCV